MKMMVKHLNVGDKFDILGTKDFWWTRGEKSFVCLTKRDADICVECINREGDIAYIWEDQVVDTFQRKMEPAPIPPRICKCG